MAVLLGLLVYVSTVRTLSCAACSATPVSLLHFSGHHLHSPSIDHMSQYKIIFNSLLCCSRQNIKGPRNVWVVSLLAFQLILFILYKFFFVQCPVVDCGGRGRGTYTASCQCCPQCKKLTGEECTSANE